MIDGEHKTERREKVDYHINELWCIEPGCEYENKLAVQGHCHSVVSDEMQRHIQRLYDRAHGTLDFYRTRYRGEEYVRVLESMFLCMEMNWTSCLDEVIILRAKNAALKLELENK